MKTRATCTSCGENRIEHPTGSMTEEPTGYCGSCYYTVDADEAAPYWLGSVIKGVSSAIQSADFSKCVREAECKKELRRAIRRTCGFGTASPFDVQNHIFPVVDGPSRPDMLIVNEAEPIAIEIKLLDGRGVKGDFARMQSGLGQCLICADSERRHTKVKKRTHLNRYRAAILVAIEKGEGARRVPLPTIYRIQSFDRWFWIACLRGQREPAPKAAAMRAR
jgi:hypothetical protein